MRNFVRFRRQLSPDNDGYLFHSQAEFLRNLPSVMSIEDHPSTIEFNRNLHSSLLDVLLQCFSFFCAQRLKKLVGIILLGCDGHSSSYLHTRWRNCTPFLCQEVSVCCSDCGAADGRRVKSKFRADGHSL